jgi:hypothetical protein
MPKGKKGFQPGHKFGGGTTGRPGRVKAKYLKKWEEVFDSCNPEEKLMELADSNFPEFIKLGLAAMPKETKIQTDINIFEGRSDAELEYFAVNGRWLDENEVLTIEADSIDVPVLPSPDPNSIEAGETEEAKIIKLGIIDTVKKKVRRGRPKSK